ncbi:MAG: hypothetical protein OXD29_15900, partial [Roseovarius sp.]|nr:hypothetical protein [Roseovarius sp.]
APRPGKNPKKMPDKGNKIAHGHNFSSGSYQCFIIFSLHFPDKLRTGFITINTLMENFHNPSIVLKSPGTKVIRHLTTMIECL